MKSTRTPALLGLFLALCVWTGPSYPQDAGAGTTGGNLRYVRGDFNGSGDVSLSDSLFLLYYLFQGGQQPPMPYP